MGPGGAGQGDHEGPVSGTRRGRSGGPGGAGQGDQEGPVSGTRRGQ